MAEKQKILIVDDDPSISELISLYLEKEMFDTTCAEDGEEALKIFPEYKPNLVILDLMLPGIDGYEVCRRLRTTSPVPIIMLSAKGETFDKVLGLELGADDYMIKPFESKELVARVKAVLRRYQHEQTAESSAETTRSHVQSESEEALRSGNFIEYTDLIINKTNYSVFYRGHAVEMPPKELELLFFLASSPNQVFTREQLLDHIWGYEFAGDSRTVDVHIKRLREKISGNTEWEISTVWGIGYKFRVG
ncbi:response regulator transcription factor [Oribacterium sp. WCC10]|uniref:response regulator transcription factor n=1 Tax=Oribacterium sp. WCC10 TaxID=1855343 RepID=UPI0008E656D2|nr:response regulator transcription factor [Oribacterium sp. WCC10]SFG15756.1 DNA-binding response regulator, OmpR family, contains REC and winged-helix (wHTH) domain [Oribacterium sp. WCC10]